MDRNELTFAIAGALVAAFLLGWTLRWGFARLNASGPRNAARAADMAARLHAAEDARHRAEARLAEAEAEAEARAREAAADLDAARAALARSEAQAEEIRTAYRRALLDQAPSDS